MKHFSMGHFRGSLLGAASRIAALGGSKAVTVTRGRAPETKDGGDPASISREVKEAMESFQKSWGDFKTKNDEAIAELKRGRDDVVTRDQLDKLNKAIDDAQVLVKRRIDDMEAKANAMALAGGPGGVAADVKAAADFAELIERKEFTPEQFKEYRGHLSKYLRRDEKAVSMSVGTDPSGGYYVTPDTSGRIIKKVYESTPMRQLATVVSVGSDTLEGPIDNGEFDAAWVGEKQTRAQTDAAQFGKWVIPVNELYAYPWVTQKLLEDAKIDIEAWLGTKSGDKFARKENTAYISGDGELKPKGLLSYAMAATADGAGRPWGTFEFVSSGVANSAAFIALNAGATDKIIDLIYALKAAYRQNAKFLMSRSTVGMVRKLKDGQGNYVWAPGATAGQPSQLFNFDIAEGEDMPAVATAATPIAFGDFGETYTIVDRLGIGVVRDNITQPGFVKFHMRKRVGGGAINFESMKFLKFT
jgi:HK97 family phage major capsid protein